MPTQAFARDGGRTVTMPVEQYQEVMQELARLRADVDQLKANQQATQQQAAQAQASATQAQTTATQAQTAANQAQASATKAQTAANDVKDASGSFAWAKDTKVSGRMYFNISHVSAKDAAGNNVYKGGGFDITRFYVGIDHKFNKVLSGNVTMDIKHISGVGDSFYVKKAYLEANFSPALDVRLGATDMPWVPYVEGIYGYRHIEKVVNDLDGFGTSSDWGVHVKGALANGIVSYQIAAVDGAGYRNPQFSKSVDLEGRVSVKYKGFNAAIGGYTGKLGKNVQGATTFHTASRFNALLAYKGELGEVPFTVGGEYFHAKNWKTVTSVASDSSDGYSLFASVVPFDKWSVFGRYDWVKPSKILNPMQKDQYYNFGIQYSPAKIVDLAIVYKRDNADDGLAIGNLSSGQQTRDEIGLYGQFRW